MDRKKKCPVYLTDLEIARRLKAVWGNHQFTQGQIDAERSAVSARRPRPKKVRVEFD